MSIRLSGFLVGVFIGAIALAGCRGSEKNSALPNPLVTLEGRRYTLPDFVVTVPHGFVDPNFAWLLADDETQDVLDVVDESCIDVDSKDPDCINFIVEPSTNASLEEVLESRIAWCTKSNRVLIMHDTLEVNGYHFVKMLIGRPVGDKVAMMYTAIIGGKEHTVTFETKKARADYFFSLAEPVLRTYKAR